MKKTVSLFILIFFVFSVFASKVDTLVVYSKSMNKKIKNVVITPDSYSKKGGVRNPSEHHHSYLAGREAACRFVFFSVYPLFGSLSRPIE